MTIHERRADTATLLSATGHPADPDTVEHHLTHPTELASIAARLLAACGWNPDDDGDPAPNPIPQDDDLPIAA